MAAAQDLEFMAAALAEARVGAATGGIPIGAVLVIDGKIVGRGHNQRLQRGSVTLHGEMSALEDAGRLPACDYQRATLYTTLSPCAMCSGAALLYGIPRVVLAGSRTFQGEDALLRSRGVEVVDLDLTEARTLLREFIDAHPDVWNEDIGT